MCKTKLALIQFYKASFLLAYLILIESLLIAMKSKSPRFLIAIIQSTTFKNIKPFLLPEVKEQGPLDSGDIF